jgi:hypothetical protein
MEAWITPALANGIGVVGVVFVFGVLIWRGYLVPRPSHLELVQLHQHNAENAEERADRWEAVAVRALDATEKLTEPVVVAAKVMTKLPNPAQEGADT